MTDPQRAKVSVFVASDDRVSLELDGAFAGESEPDGRCSVTLPSGEVVGLSASYEGGLGGGWRLDLDLPAGSAVGRLEPLG